MHVVLSGLQSASVCVRVPLRLHSPALSAPGGVDAFAVESSFASHSGFADSLLRHSRHLGAGAAPQLELRFLRFAAAWPPGLPGHAEE